MVAPETCGSGNVAATPPTGAATPASTHAGGHPAIFGGARSAGVNCVTGTPGSSLQAVSPPARPLDVVAASLPPQMITVHPPGSEDVGAIATQAGAENLPREEWVPPVAVVGCGSACAY